MVLVVRGRPLCGLRREGMTPDTPILMITLQIPVTADTNADQVLDAIGKQVSDAIYAIKQQQTVEDPEAIPQEEFNEWVTQETQEAYTDAPRDDLLAQLGYKA